MKTIRIFQVKKDLNDLAFMSYDFTQKHGGINLNNYEEVYSCERPDNYDLEDAFLEFNMKRPSNYIGHSLSVSDIVEMDNKKYFCDLAGWKEVDD